MIHGQDKAVAQFTSAWRSRAMHHGWLLGGPRGVGKARFARLAARRLLADAAGPAIDLPGLETPANHPVGRLVEAQSHPDFRLLERLERERGDGLARNISVRQVRELGALFTVAPALSPWRVAIIDSVDDLEKEGANALLKMLEEPPANCLFLLVSHAPGRLLPTIRSRCRRLDFEPLGNADMAAALAEALPHAAPAERERLASLAGGSVGRAIAYAELDLAPLAAEALSIISSGDGDNLRRSALARSLAGKAAAARYAAFLELAPALIAREARGLSGEPLARALRAYDEARQTSTAAPRLSLDPAATAFRLGSILASVHGASPSLS